MSTGNEGSVAETILLEREEFKGFRCGLAKPLFSQSSLKLFVLSFCMMLLDVVQHVGGKISNVWLFYLGDLPHLFLYLLY
jgi:hypothetical protein